MSSQKEFQEDLEKILRKSFDDIQKRFLTLVLRREKKLLKELKHAAKETKAATGTGKRGRPRKEKPQESAHSETDEH